MRSQAGILETDDQHALSAKLEAALTEPDPQTRNWMKDRLAPLVGLQTSSQPPQQDEVFTAWRRFLEQITQAGPMVMVFEDLHWADEAFLSFLEHLAERVTGLPLLIITTTRTEIEERHPAWLDPAARATVLWLRPLADEHVQVLIEETLTGASPGLIKTVLDRAGGSPLYAEQLAAMLRDRGLQPAGVHDETLIPPSVQALIAARIDGLRPGLKLTLMNAAVVGRTFWSEALSTVRIHQGLQSELAELARREFIRPVDPSSMAGDSEFIFWHALVRDVAYAELTRGDRARIHAKVARWFDAAAPGEPGRHAELVVQHLDAALELASSAPDLDTAELNAGLTIALLAAGEDAMRTRVGRAIPFLKRALGAMPEDDGRRAKALFSLSQVHSSLGDLGTASSLYEDLLTLQEGEADFDATADTVIAMQAVLWRLGEGSRADALVAAEGRKQLAAGPSLALAKIIAVEAYSRLNSRDFENALQMAGECIRMAEGLDLAPPPLALAAQGLARVVLGDPHGQADVRLAHTQFIAAGEPYAAARELVNLGNAMNTVNGPAAALKANDEAIEVGKRFGMDGMEWVCRALRMENLADLGRFGDILAGWEPILSWADAHEDAFCRSVVLVSLARVDVDSGSRHVGPLEVKAVAESLGDGGYLVYAALLALDRGEIDLAHSLLPSAIESTEQSNTFVAARACIQAGLPDLVRDMLKRGVTHYPVEEASRAAAKAVLHEANRHFDAACTDYARAARAFEMLDMPLDRAHALQGLGRCFIGAGNLGEGAGNLREARHLFELMPATRRVIEIDQFLA